MRLSPRIDGIAESATLALDARYKALKQQGVDVVGFGAGEPDFPTPEHVKEAGIAAIRANFTRYTAAGGIEELRSAIVDRLREDQGVRFDPSQAIVTSGAKHAVFDVVQALCAEGDEVIIPSPYWVSYPEIVKTAGATPIVVECRESEGWRLDPERLRRAVTRRTRLVIVNSPGNPTGWIGSREEMQALVDLAKAHDFFVLSDEIYSKLASPGTFVGPASLPGADGRVIVVDGCSKAYCMTGWRIGWAVGPKPLVQAMLRFQSHAMSHPSSISQKAAVAALLGDQTIVRTMAEEFERRRRVMVDGLRRIPGFTISEPKGAFYAFPRVSAFFGARAGSVEIRDSASFAEACLDVARVALVPGGPFGAEGFVRLSYATSTDEIRRGLERLGEFACSLDRPARPTATPI
jgi:aspartate aminotransferase